MLEKQDLTFSKVESWQEFMLSHRMASEMECGLNQNGIFLVSDRVTLSTSRLSNLIGQMHIETFEHAPPIRVELVMNCVNVLMS